uniref:F-box domain-containing protein n=1 Tax=Heterorhabditis bacteriophora TaxID=37862 RepID=A0A1I7XSL7_HETBA
MRQQYPIIPSLPDIALRQIFSYLSYRELCRVERVCRRWMNIIQYIMRRDIHEITIERLGETSPSAVQLITFRRLAVSCPRDAFDFLSGVIRRSRLSIVRMTIDLEFLSNIGKIRISKEERRKYFSNVEDLWLLVTCCQDNIVDRLLEIEEMLFSEIQHLTLQVHIFPHLNRNVGRVVWAFSRRHPKATINLELHAAKSTMIFDQLCDLSCLVLNNFKIICSEFDLPQLKLDQLYYTMKNQNIVAKNITIRDWTLTADGTSPIVYNPLDTFRISSCTIETVDNLVKCLLMTVAQVKAVKKKVPYIKRLEIAGHCVLYGLQFLEVNFLEIKNKAHTELAKRLGTAIPDLEVDCSEIYYCCLLARVYSLTNGK